MSRYEVTLPVKVPQQAATDLYQIIRDGKLVEKRADAFLAFQNVIGYVGGVGFGNPDVVSVIGSGISPETPCASHEEGMAALQAFASQPPVEEGVAQAIPWGVLLNFLVQFVLPKILS